MTDIVAGTSGKCIQLQVFFPETKKMKQQQQKKKECHISSRKHTSEENKIKVFKYDKEPTATRSHLITSPYLSSVSGRTETKLVPTLRVLHLDTIVFFFFFFFFFFFCRRMKTAIIIDANGPSLLPRKRNSFSFPTNKDVIRRSRKNKRKQTFFLAFVFFSSEKSSSMMPAHQQAYGPSRGTDKRTSPKKTQKWDSILHKKNYSKPTFAFI